MSDERRKAVAGRRAWLRLVAEQKLACLADLGTSYCSELPALIGAATARPHALLGGLGVGSKSAERLGFQLRSASSGSPNWQHQALTGPASPVRRRRRPTRSRHGGRRGPSKHSLYSRSRPQAAFDVVCGG